LVKLSNVAAGHRLLERDVDGVVDALEPNGYVWNECHFGAQLGANLPLVDVICEAVRDEVVC
jgi:hypothetical protein